MSDKIPTDAPSEPPRCICGHNRSTHMPRTDDSLHPLGKCQGVQNDYPCPCTRYEVRAAALAVGAPAAPIPDDEPNWWLRQVRQGVRFANVEQGIDNLT